MAEVIRMPKMSDTMEEGVIASWLVKEGDQVKSGDILAEVETDKATMELESYDDGVLLHIGVKEKDAVPVNGVIAIIGKTGEDISGVLSEIQGGATSGASAPAASPQEEPKTEIAEEIDTSGINATAITMPKMSDTMTEGTIASWLKKVGDAVKSGDILAEVETDKATMELEAYDDGTLLYIGVEEGDSVVVDGVIAVVGEKGADYELLLKAQSAKKTEAASEATQPAVVEAKAEPEIKVQAEPKSVGTTQSSSNGRVKASPLAKKLAQEKGYDISLIPGTGEHGRIVKKDVESYQPSQTASPASSGSVSVGIPQVVGEESYEEVKVSQMRKAIAKRVAESKYEAPHFYVTMEINMDKAIDARKSMNEYSPVKISFNDLVVRATAAALRLHPKVNSSWLGDTIRFNNHIHMGVAMAVEEGVIIPVVRYADNKSLSHIAAEVKELATKAKNKELQPTDWEGSTFTISNLGMFGVEEFTAIVNPPNACILAVGGIKQTPIVRDGQVVPGNVMKVTLSCDHRAVDGALGAAFLKTLKELLENPVRILV